MKKRKARRMRVSFMARRRNPSRSRYRRNPGGPADTIAARELELYITNDRLLYQNQARYIIVNLAKKLFKRTYDRTKALKLWGYLADAGAQRYTKEFDASSSRAHGTYGAFSPATRRATAVELQKRYNEELYEAHKKLARSERIKP